MQYLVFRVPRLILPCPNCIRARILGLFSCFVQKLPAMPGFYSAASGVTKLNSVERTVSLSFAVFGEVALFAFGCCPKDWAPEVAATASHVQFGTTAVPSRPVFHFP